MARLARYQLLRTRLHSLPEPSAQERERTRDVEALIGASIDAAGGCLAFDRFMELALYAPGLGYYAGGAVKFGAQGDFVTAPELGSLFGRCVARQCAEVLDVAGGGSVLEFGAGSGALCRQILECLAELGALPDRYLILETSADLRGCQEKVVAGLPDVLSRRVEWLERPPDSPLTGAVVANEVLDAMPVTRFRVTDDGYAVLGVRRNEAGFAWCETAPKRAHREIASLVERHALPSGYVSEYNPRAAAWMAQLSGWLERGAAFIVDYGYPASEYYHHERASGTLKCFFHHAAHDDPLRLAGVQDITAHVDFSALAGAARAAELDVMGFVNQASFLVGAGLMDDLARAAEKPESQLALANEVKRLTLPGEMGETFKVLAVGRGLSVAPGAFKDNDRSHVL
ncbi:MAG: SAM-dependent methyltransferase [Proteobacteria bacterium]|nr:MAG: SAM-dependent methyltransferase [Pseudomonadota bacterium]